MRDKMPRKGGRWWFSWRGRNTTIKEVSTGNEGVFPSSSANFGLVECVLVLMCQRNKPKAQHSVSRGSGRERPPRMRGRYGGRGGGMAREPHSPPDPVTCRGGVGGCGQVTSPLQLLHL